MRILILRIFIFLLPIKEIYILKLIKLLRDNGYKYMFKKMVYKWVQKIRRVWRHSIRNSKSIFIFKTINLMILTNKITHSYILPLPAIMTIDSKESMIKIKNLSFMIILFLMNRYKNKFSLMILLKDKVIYMIWTLPN